MGKITKKTKIIIAGAIGIAVFGFAAIGIVKNLNNKDTKIVKAYCLKKGVQFEKSGKNYNIVVETDSEMENLLKGTGFVGVMAQHASKEAEFEMDNDLKEMGFKEKSSLMYKTKDGRVVATVVDGNLEIK